MQVSLITLYSVPSRVVFAVRHETQGRERLREDWRDWVLLWWRNMHTFGSEGPI